MNPAKAPSVDKTLRKLFLTIFLRGHTSRGIGKAGVPTSIAQKLGLTLLLYSVFGIIAAVLIGKPVFPTSLFLHGLTLLVVGTFVTASAGEILFNKEEGEILTHRPVSSRSLLTAKVIVLVQVSLYMAAAVNLVGFGVGVTASDGGWLFLPVHAISCLEEAVFCAGCVVLLYQLCLKWFGRERLENMMTMAQVFLMIGLVTGSQLMTRQVAVLQKFTGLKAWWANLLPPAWFAGLDDAFAGSHARNSWILAAVGVGVTALIGWLAFVKLACSYNEGLQTMNEATESKPRQRAQLRVLQKLSLSRPFSWMLKGSVERASFVLIGAYVFRDRETKLRLYPGLAPFLMMPIVFVFSGQEFKGAGAISDFMQTFPAAICGTYIGIVPSMGLSMLKYSQQWKASEVFQIAPTSPWPIIRGAQVAAVVLLAVPMFVVFGLYFGISRGPESLLLLLPGLIMLPAYASLPFLADRSIPLSKPTEDARAANRNVIMMFSTIGAPLFGAFAAFMWGAGHFTYLVLGELIVVGAVTYGIDRYLKQMVWQPEV